MRSRSLRGACAALVAVAVVSVPLAAPADASTKPVRFKNCTALHKRFPHGVGLTTAHDKVAKGRKPVTNFARSNAWYKLNKGLDRDHDGVACEAH